MSINKEPNASNKPDWSIPLWFRVLVAVVTLSTGVVLIRTLMSDQTALLGISVTAILIVSASLLTLLLPITIGFWFFPESAFSLFCYWLIRFMREQFIVLSLLGILYLSTLHAPLFSLRGGLPLTTLLVVFLTSLYLKPVGLLDVPHSTIDNSFRFIGNLLAGVENIPARMLRILVAVTPVAIVCFVIYFVFGSRLSNYGPYSIWNDETSYWVWLRSFTYSGFNSGYNAPNELLSAFEFSRYGEASPFYLYLYGMITRLVGWFPVLPVLINFFLLSVSIYVLLSISKFDNWQVVFTGLALVLTWPVLLYLPITTHETLNQLLGIWMAVIFIKLQADRKKFGVCSRLAIVLLVYFATLVRLSWGLMLIPVLFYCLNGRPLWRGILSVLVGGGLYLSVVILMGYMLPPINNSILGGVRGWVAEGPKIFIEKIHLQLTYLFLDNQNNPNIGVVFQMAMIIGWGVARLFQPGQQNRRDLGDILQSPEALNVYNMTSLGLAGFTFYLYQGFYRTFAPAMLIAYFLLIVRKDFKFLVSLLLVNILLFSSYMNYYYGVGDYQVVKSDYTETIPRGSLIQTRIGKYVIFDSDAPTPWCNTLLIPLKYYDSRLMLIPPGIGISYILIPETFQPPIKSRYTLFDPSTYEAYSNTTKLELLASLPIGNLYRNLDVECRTLH